MVPATDPGSQTLGPLPNDSKHTHGYGIASSEAMELSNAPWGSHHPPIILKTGPKTYFCNIEETGGIKPADQVLKPSSELPLPELLDRWSSAAGRDAFASVSTQAH